MHLRLPSGIVAPQLAHFIARYSLSTAEYWHRQVYRPHARPLYRKPSASMNLLSGQRSFQPRAENVAPGLQREQPSVVEKDGLGNVAHKLAAQRQVVEPIWGREV